MERYGLAGKVRLVRAGIGWPGSGKILHGRNGVLGSGKARLDGDLHGMAGLVWRRAACYCRARRGMVEKRKGSENMEATVFSGAYLWKRNMSVKADVAAAELDRIRRKNADGILNPEEVVYESKAEDAVLHKLFEWDDTKAANGYRVEQAKYIIRNLVRREETDDGPIITRTIVSTGNRAYLPIETVMSDAEMRRNLLESAKQDMLALKMKYRHLTELAKVWVAIDEIL